MEKFVHINDVWDYLDDNSHTLKDIEKAFGEIPNKFGSFDIINKETYKQDKCFEICNSWWNEDVGDMEYDYHTITKEN